MTKTHTKTKTKWFLRSIFLKLGLKCSSGPKSSRSGVFYTGPRHKADLLRRPAKHIKPPLNLICIQTHTQREYSIVAIDKLHL